MPVKGFLTTKEAAEKLGVTDSRIRQMVLDGTIKGAEKFGRDNMIPEKEVARLAGIDRPAGRPAKEKKPE